MAGNPIAPRRWPTAMERARADYVAGRIDVGELERRAEALIRSGREDDRGPGPPPRRADALAAAAPPGFRGIGVAALLATSTRTPEPGGLPPAAGHAHEWGMIERGRIFCDAPGCRASAPMTDDEALAFVWGAGPPVRLAPS